MFADENARASLEMLLGPSSDPSGGARRDRTDDLLLAKQALSQLSYGPFREQVSGVRDQEPSMIRLMPGS